MWEGEKSISFQSSAPSLRNPRTKDTNRSRRSNPSELAEASSIFEEITKRRTHFVGYTNEEDLISRSDSTPEYVKDDRSPVSEACSDGVLINKERRESIFRPWKKQQRKPMSLVHFEKKEDASTTEEEEIRATGHFSPLHSQLDITKIRRSILDTARLNERGNNKDEMMQLKAQLSSQDEIMKRLIQKLDLLEKSEVSDIEKKEGTVVADDLETLNHSLNRRTRTEKRYLSD